jgi:hypothetical protein
MMIAQIPNMPISYATNFFNRDILISWITVTMNTPDFDMDSWCSFIGYDGL